ncbi:hypothetical protein RDI58_026872 [Solanum bulbocastanum]|uniref:DUF4283 domain-containing protein n=1 Tax=Solanum bulbocastanum TaxID=147425 RepID=A0AAN8Y1L4_SOLBU
MLYLMRTLKWDPCFDLVEETSTTSAWISFPSLPPILFWGRRIVRPCNSSRKTIASGLGHKK